MKNYLDVWDSLAVYPYYIKQKKDIWYDNLIMMELIHTRIEIKRRLKLALRSM